jgi:predicted metal-dependent peptidase
LIAEKAFKHLKGLLYFTDGKGIYPRKKPPYATAFVFLSENYEDTEVPSWAMKLILEPEDLKGKQEM